MKRSGSLSRSLLRKGNTRSVLEWKGQLTFLGFWAQNKKKRISEALLHCYGAKRSHFHFRLAKEETADQWWFSTKNHRLATQSIRTKEKISNQRPPSPHSRCTTCRGKIFRFMPFFQRILPFHLLHDNPQVHSFDLQRHKMCLKKIKEQIR